VRRITELFEIRGPLRAFTQDAANAMVFDQTPSARPLPNLERLRAFDAWYTCVWGRKPF
jgi:hypothetical protein